MANNKHVGRLFDDFLKEEGIYEEVCRCAQKKVGAVKKSSSLTHISCFFKKTKNHKGGFYEKP